MAYCDIITLKSYIRKDILVQLTDDNDSDQVDDSKIDYAISQASELIDGYIRGRFDLPLSTVPGLIADIAVKLTGYFLYKRALTTTLPEAIKEDYKEAMHILGDIQRGRVNPFPTADNPTWFRSNKSSSSSSVVSTATNNWSDYLVRAPTFGGNR